MQIYNKYLHNQIYLVYLFLWKIKNKPKLATENAIKNYSFDKSDKFGDNCFDTRCGFFNDNMVTQNALPVGTISTTADYYDSVNNISFDGLLLRLIL